VRSSTGAAATIAMKTDNVYKAARQYELMTAFGTDILLFSSALATQQGALLVSLARW
jgi:hypothetical protein